MKQVWQDIGKGLLAARGAPLIGLGLSLVVLVGAITYAPQAQHALGFQGPNVVAPTDTALPTDTPTPTDTPLPVATNTPVPTPDLAVSPGSQTFTCGGGQLAIFTITNTGSKRHAWNTASSNTAFVLHPANSSDIGDGFLYPGASATLQVDGFGPSGTSGQITIYQGGRDGEDYSVAAVVTVTCA